MCPLPFFRAFILPVLVAAGCLASSSAALAAGVSPLDASPDQKKEATDHFFAGKRALDAHDFAAAITELTASVAVVDSPNAHLELARALRDAARFDEAWTEYGLAQATGTMLAPREARYGKAAEAAAAERADVEKRLGFVAISVAHAPADAILKVGARTVPPREWGAPVPVLPGAVDVVLEDATGAELTSKRSIVAIGAVASISLDAQRASAPASGGPARVAAGADGDEQPAEPAKLPSDVAPIAPPTRSALRPLAFVTGGLGVVGFATFAVFGLMSNATYADLKSACPRGCPTDHHDEIEAGKMEQTVANVGLAVGIAGIAVGTTLFVLGGRSSSSSSPSSSPSAGLVVAPGYVGLRGAL